MTIQAYASIEDFLEVLSPDSQAKLTNDPATFWTIGTGDGVVTTFDTPWVRTSSITGLLIAGTPAAPHFTLSRGTGTDGVDRVVFTSAPTGLIEGKADGGAAVRQVLVECLEKASDDVDGYLPGITPATDPVVIRKLAPKVLFLARWRLRRRRNLEAKDAERDERKDVIRWLELVAKKPELLTGTSGAASVRKIAIDSDDVVFGDDSAVL